ETSYRLLWAARNEPRETAAYLLQSALMERALRAEAMLNESEMWTALGDSCWTGTELVHEPTIEGLSPLDFRSPYARRVDQGGAWDVCKERRDGFSEREIELILQKLRTVRNGILEVSQD